MHALFHRRDVLARHHAALDRVDELEALAGFLRLDLEHDVAVLALAARLAHELAFGVVDRLADGFAVGHLRLADVGFHAELALHAVDDDFEVQLAHAGDDGLARFLVGLDAERRVFLRPGAAGRCPSFPGRPWSWARRPARSRTPGTPCARASRWTSGRTGFRPWSLPSGPRRRRCRRRGFRLTSSRLLACICTIRPMRSFLPRIGL